MKKDVVVAVNLFMSKGRDPFSCLGLKPCFSLSMEELDQHYLAALKRAHPDMHIHASQQERLTAQQQAAAINKAYQTLKDPYERAQELLQLHLGNSPERTDLPGSAEMLEEMFIWRERLSQVVATESLSSSQGAIMAAQRRHFIETLQQTHATSYEIMAGAFEREAFEEAATEAKRYRYLSKTVEDFRSRVLMTSPAYT